jgi:Flp pilus assembly protein TadG
MKRRHGSGRNRETGAVAVIVAVTMVVSIGAAAFAVDLGSAWESQRRLHTATDSAALAAAQEYAFGNDGCGGTDDTYVTNNDDVASVTECQRVGTTASGYVSVSAERPVDFHFAKIFGIDGTDVDSSTTAAYGSPLAVTGLRPIAVCKFFPALQEWLNEPDGPLGPSEPIQMPRGNTDIGCSTAAGNWGWLDLDDGGGGANQLEDDLINGSEEVVEIPGELAPKPGNVASTADALNYLVNEEIEFPIPLINNVTGTGNNARFHAVGVATVKLVAFMTDGPSSDHWFRFIFTPKMIEGTCCSDDSLDTGTKVVNICAVEDDFDVSRCQP